MTVDKKDPHQRGKYSREKGKRFERELANRLKEYGYDTRRSVQYSGKNGDADVVGLPFIHIEAKAVEKLNIYNAMAQAVGDSQSGEFPTVFQKRSREDILVTMRFEDWMELYKAYEKANNK